MSERLEREFAAAKENGACFITITKKLGNDKLKHYQYHSSNFAVEDLVPSLNELEVLVRAAHPEELGT